MRLLICTQTVDARDSHLGFFVRWIEEFSKHCEKVTVICLKEGRYKLPENVKVYELGKSVGSIRRAVRLFSLSWKLRKEYDAVFVHMNPEYIVVAGRLWRLMDKKIALWYTHKSVNLKLRVAVLLAHVVFTASKESFRLATKKVRVMGHGIDTDFFTPDSHILRGAHLLSVGRLMPSKRHDVAVRMAAEQGRTLLIAGEGPERESLEALARSLNTPVEFLGGLTQLQLRDEYRKAAVLLHTSETGSLDKVVLEALACGLPVKTADPALTMLETAGPEYVRAHHSLAKLIPAILAG